MKQSEGSFKKKWKNLKGTAKCQYIWDYYKLQIFLICIIVYVLCYLLYRGVTTEHPQLYLAYVNVDVGDTLSRHLTDEFIDFLEPEEKHSVVKTTNRLALTENLQHVDGSYVYASQMKILSEIENQHLDVVIMNREAFDAFSQNGFLFNLKDLSETCHLQNLEPYFIENIEILSDNATDVMLDPSVEYQSEITTYPMGIDITDFPIIRDAGFPDRVYLGIIANTPRPETAAAYASYLLYGEKEPA